MKKSWIKVSIQWRNVHNEWIFHTAWKLQEKGQRWMNVARKMSVIRVSWEKLSKM